MADPDADSSPHIPAHTMLRQKATASEKHHRFEGKHTWPVKNLQLFVVCFLLTWSVPHLGKALPLLLPPSANTRVLFPALTEPIQFVPPSSWPAVTPPHPLFVRYWMENTLTTHVKWLRLMDCKCPKPEIPEINLKWLIGLLEHRYQRPYRRYRFNRSRNLAKLWRW